MRLRGREGNTSKKLLNEKLISTTIFHEAMNLLRDNNKGKERHEFEATGGGRDGSGLGRVFSNLALLRTH